MRRIVTLSLGLLLLVGCTSSKSTTGIVHGTITYKDQPVNGAVLYLNATATGGSDFVIPVSQDGVFSTTGVVPGEYKIVVKGSSGMSGVPSTKGMDPAKAAEMQAKIEAMKSPPTIQFPDKYKDIHTTPLLQPITAGEQTLTLVLQD